MRFHSNADVRVGSRELLGRAQMRSRPLVRGRQIRHRPVEQLLARVAAQRHERRVHLDEARVEIGHRDRVSGALEQLPITRLGALTLSLETPHVGDVLHGADHANLPSGGIVLHLAEPAKDALFRGVVVCGKLDIDAGVPGENPLVCRPDAGLIAGHDPQEHVLQGSVVTLRLEPKELLEFRREVNLAVGDAHFKAPDAGDPLRPGQSPLTRSQPLQDRSTLRHVTADRERPDHVAAVLLERPAADLERHGRSAPRPELLLVDRPVGVAARLPRGREAASASGLLLDEEVGDRCPDEVLAGAAERVCERGVDVEESFLHVDDGDRVERTLEQLPVAALDPAAAGHVDECAEHADERTGRVTVRRRDQLHVGEQAVLVAHPRVSRPRTARNGRLDHLSGGHRILPELAHVLPHDLDGSLVAPQSERREVRIHNPPVRVRESDRRRRLLDRRDQHRRRLRCRVSRYRRSRLTAQLASESTEHRSNRWLERTLSAHVSARSRRTCMRRRSNRRAQVRFPSGAGSPAPIERG